jgi:hypothetical protein
LYIVVCLENVSLIYVHVFHTFDPFQTATSTLCSRSLSPDISNSKAVNLDLVGATVTLVCNDKTATGTFQKETSTTKIFFKVVTTTVSANIEEFAEIRYLTPSVTTPFITVTTSTFTNPLEFDLTLQNTACANAMLTINLASACDDEEGVVFDLGTSPSTPGSGAGNLVVFQLDGGTCGKGSGRTPVPVTADFKVGIGTDAPLGDLYLQYKFDLSSCNLDKKVIILADTDRATKGECTTGTYGDPHFETFGGQHYDFQGACDLVLVDNAGYKDGKGLFIHGRTQLFGSWSSLVSAAVMIGDDIMEVHGEDLALINGVECTIPAVEGEHLFPMTIGGYSLTVQILGPHSRAHIIHMGDGEKILINNFKGYVNVFLQHPKADDFALSTGMWGTFGPHGAMVARDGRTLIEDADTFGNEWQVRPNDPQLFHIIDGPQYPAKCQMPETPTAEQRHLRAMSKKVSEDDAKTACAKTSPARMENCIADVFGSDNLDMAELYQSH